MSAAALGRIAIKDQRTPEQLASLGNFSTLPKELILYLLNFLDFTQLKTTALLSKEWGKLSEEWSTSLGKIKRIFRVLNSSVQVTKLSVEEQKITLSYKGELCLEVKGETVYKKNLLNEGECTYSNYRVSSQHFVIHTLKSGPTPTDLIPLRWSSYQFDFETKSVSTIHLPPFPSVTGHPDEEIFSLVQEGHFLHLQVRSEALKTFHLLTYMIDENEGPTSLFLKEIMHVVCHKTKESDEVTLIERKNIRKETEWSRAHENIGRVWEYWLREKWLVMLHEHEGHFKYLFLDITSNQKIFTLDLSLKNQVEQECLIKDNICLLTDSSGDNPRSVVLQLDAKKLIPLSFQAQKTLFSLEKDRRFKLDHLSLENAKEIKFDFISENGFFEIQGSRQVENRKERVAIRFSANPSVSSTSFIPSPPFSLLDFIIRKIGAKNVEKLVLFTLVCVVYLVYISFKWVFFKTIQKIKAFLIVEKLPTR